MERKVVAVCVLICFLSFLFAGLGFAAEFTNIKVSGIIRTKDDHCLYPRTPASLLGMLSTLFFMFAHISIYAAAGCICCQIRLDYYDSTCTIALICYVISWMVSLPATLLLLHCVFLNDQGCNKMSATSDLLVSFCDVAGNGIFPSGAALVLTRNSLGMVYYLLLRPLKRVVPVTEDQLNGGFFGPGDIAMIVQPQFPCRRPCQQLAPVPESTPPVFVHEDIYNRMQFA